MQRGLRRRGLRGAITCPGGTALRAAVVVSGVIVWCLATGAVSVLPTRSFGSVTTPSGTSAATAWSTMRSEVDRTVPPGSWVLALTTVIVAGPSGAAADTPVSTAAMAATTASFLRCHDAARARLRSGRRRGRATDGMGGMAEAEAPAGG